MTSKLVGRKIWVKGIVQGVGFRPFVFTLAARFHLTGWVRNTSSGVELEINGADADCNVFYEAIQSELPPLARIDAITSQDIAFSEAKTFEIFSSVSEIGMFIPISPDVSTCSACEAELFDSSNRRFRYPFINCTHCGPRFSIIRDVPYDRPKTTMESFQMCPDCAREYEDPLDRRFHAQPIACPVCGPQIELVLAGTKVSVGDSAIHHARQMLKEGKILAIKGLGGYHLACDACNPVAVETLRRRKKRSDKPFALMAFDLAAIERHSILGEAERELLRCRQKPIVLVNRREESAIAPAVAPQLNILGMMLPYTPLHLLLLEPELGYPDALVMTSGNLSDEPIAYSDPDAFERLSPLADAFLIHNRSIHMRVDDSVARISANQTVLIRRSRGYAPDTIQLPIQIPSILATGAELKNTFCLTRERYAFLSHHIGDMENLETYDSFEKGIKHFENLFRIQPQAIACDPHPNYLATRYAIARAQDSKLPIIQVQHHHAHLAACLADNGWSTTEPVIGLIYDGTGLGTDNSIWGGEVLLGGYQGYQRLFHLAYTPLPGGDISIRKPARMALAHLWQAGLEWEEHLPPVMALCAEERSALSAQLRLKTNTPMTSSMGRLFDAAAALVGVRQEATYEAQASIEFEALADPDETGFYPITIRNAEFDPAPLWKELISDWQRGTPVSLLSARFHNSIARLSFECSLQIRSEAGVEHVVLSGGVWQNRVLLEKTIHLLTQEKFKVLIHHQIPTNDGGISLGQALVAAYSLSI